MDTTRSEIRTKLRRDLSREAIALALEGHWGKAIEVNRRTLQIFPEDVDAMNRLGKAYLEMGQYSAARTAFESAARIAPHNTIAKKNLDRLAHLQDSAPAQVQGKVVTPYLFIEESGKSGVTVLHNSAPRQVLGKMAAGDAVKLVSQANVLVVENNHGDCVGQVEPKLGMRLMRLMKGGNRYDAAIVNISRQQISIIISETHRHPDLGNVYSFPTKSKEEYRVYWKDARLRYDIDSELEQDEEYTADRRETYQDGSGLSDGKEPSELPYNVKTAQDSQEDDEED